MIRALKEWLVSVVMLSFAVSLLRVLLPEGSLRKAGAFTGSLVLMAAILRPLVRLEPDFPDLDFYDYETAVAGRLEELQSAEMAEFQAQVERKSAERISEQAAALGTPLPVTVSARVENGVPVPWSVTLQGTYSPALSVWLENAFGIPAERQYWSDYSSSSSETR